MADNYDGGLNFNSKLDTKDFLKGAKEIKEEAKKTREEVQKIGSGKMSAVKVDTKSAERALENVSKKAEKAGEQIEGAGKAVSKAGDIDVSKAVEGLDALSNKAEKTKSAVTEMLRSARLESEKMTPKGKVVVPGQEKMDSEGFEKGSDRMNAAVGSMKSGFKELGNTIRGAVSGVFKEPMDDAEKMSEAAKRLSENMSEVKKGMDNLGKTDGIKEAAEGLKEAASLKTGNKEIDELAEKYRNAQEEVERLTKALDEAFEKEDELNSKFYLGEEYAKARSDAKKLADFSRQYAKSSPEKQIDIRAKANIPTTPGEAYEDTLMKASEEASRKMDELRAKFENTAPFRKTEDEIEKLSDKLGEATKKADEYKQAIDRNVQSIEEQGKVSTEASAQDTHKIRETEEPSIDSTAVEKRTLELSKAIKDANADMGDLDRISKQAAKGYKWAIDEYNEASANAKARISELKSELEDFGNTKFETESSKRLAENYKEATDELERLNKKLDEAETKAYEAHKAFEKTEEFRKLSTAPERYKKDAEEWKTGDPEKMMGVLERNQKEVPLKKGEEREYDKTLIKAAEDAKKKLEELESKFENSAAMKKTLDEIDRINEKIDIATKKAEELRAAMDGGKGTVMGKDTSGFERNEDAIANLENKIKGYDNAVQESANRDREKKSSLDFLSDALMNVGLSAGRAAVNILKTAPASVANGLKNIAVNAKNAAVGLARMVSNGLISGFKKLKSVVTGASKSINGNNINVKKSFMTILKYAFGIRSLFVAFRKLRSAVTEGLKNVMKYDLTFRATVDDFKLSLTTLKNAVGSAIAPIAQAILPVITRIIDSITEAVNHVGMLTAALLGQKNYLKATKAQAKAYQDEEKAAKAAQKTIAGFDDLTILQEQEDPDAQKNPGFETSPITDGIKGIADALKDMWQKADFTELGKMLGERLRDALNSIPWDSIKAMLRKIAHSIATFLNGFLEVPGLFDAIGRTLAQALNSAFEFLNEFVHTLHWDSLGNAIKDGIIGFLGNIDWPLIMDTFKTLGEGIAQAIGSVVSDPTLPALIGQSIANVINTAFEFILGFVTTLPWAEVGNFIAQGILSILTNINWPLIQESFLQLGTGIAEAIGAVVSDPSLPAMIGQTLANMMNTAFLFLYGFVTNFPWGNLGTAIKESILGFITGIDWRLVYRTVGTAGRGIGTALNNAVNDRKLWSEIFKAFSNTVRTLFIAIYNFIVGIDWKSLGQNIGNGFNDGVDEFPWALVAQTLVKAFNSVVDVLFNFVATFDFGKLGEDVGTLISQSIGGIEWGRFGAMIATAVSGLFDFFSNLVGNIDWASLARSIVDFITGFFGNFRWESVGQFIGNLVTGLFQFIGTLWGSVDWGKFPMQVVDTIAKILSGVNWTKLLGAMFSLFGKAFLGLAQLYSNIGGAVGKAGIMIINGLLNGIKSIITGIAKWLKDNVFDKFMKALKEVFGIASPSKEMKTIGVDVILGFLNGILDPLKNIGGFLKDNIGTPIIDGVKKLFGAGGEPALKSTGVDAIEGMKAGMGESMNTMDGFIQTDVTDPVLNGIRSGLGTDGTPVTNADGVAVVGGLEDGMGSEASGIDSWVQGTVTDPLVNGISYGLGTDGTPVTLDDGSAVVSALQEGMQQEAGGLESWVGSNVADPILDGVESPLGLGYGESGTFKGYGETMMASMKGGMEYEGAFVTEMAGQISEDTKYAFSSVDWAEIGRYIVEGLYNGLNKSWDWIYNEVTNFAGDLLNAVKYVFGIASPSKEFHWIGEMLNEGLAKGLDDSSDNAVSAMYAVTDAISQEAADAKPQIGIETALDGSLEMLDKTMAGFGDKVVNGFENMISELQDIARNAGLVLPQTAMGAIVPYASKIADISKNGPSLESVIEMVASQNANRLTKEDLRDVMAEVAREYFNFDFYLGDEQVARSANRGNVRLERRYNPARS